MTFVPVTLGLTNPEALFNHTASSLPYRSARAIRDPEVVAFIDAFGAANSLRSALENSASRIDFLTAYPEWLKASKCNTLKNLDAFRYVSFVNGTIQAFDSFYAANRNRRFRCLKGEFMYHRASWRHGYGFAYIEDEPLAPHDAVVLSIPFSDFGALHPKTDEIVAACNKLDVPVLVDCAYMNIGGGMVFDFDQPCIRTIAFSLSKTFFGLDKLRIGIRLQREFEDDPIDVFNTANMANQYSCACGLAFIHRFSPDFNFEKYRDKQIAVCRELDIEPSDCVTFGLGDDRWKSYNRGGAYNRLCINSLLERET